MFLFLFCLLFSFCECEFLISKAPKCEMMVFKTPVMSANKIMNIIINGVYREHKRKLTVDLLTPKL